MKTIVGRAGLTDNFYIRNSLALAGLLAAMYLPDIHAMQARADSGKWTPYLFVLALYCWIVFHNRVLFEQLYEQGKRRDYFLSIFFLLTFSSLNISFCMYYFYQGAWPVPVLIKFYVFSLTGFGLYIAYRYRELFTSKSFVATKPVGPFCVVANGMEYKLEPGSILYIESLENYLRVFTANAQLVTRMTLKEAASELPENFLRINRSCLVNPQHIGSRQGDEIIIGTARLRIGRTYKQLVNQRLV